MLNLGLHLYNIVLHLYKIIFGQNPSKTHAIKF
jgi:hypothetical protein